MDRLRRPLNSYVSCMQKTPTEILTKLEIAERQLNRAIILMIDHNDRVCAITLAGAAEEVLAGLLKSQGNTDVLSEIIESSIDMGKIIGQDWTIGDFKSNFNFFRNELKHHDRGRENIPIFEEAALEIIVRAIENFRRFTGTYSIQMHKFNSKYL